MGKESSKEKVGFELVRKHGFKESRNERKARLIREKQQKWDNKLQKEDLHKLEKELESLMRAQFLSPQQKERKRLVEKMLKDLNKKNKAENTPPTSPTTSSPEVSEFEGDLIMELQNDGSDVGDPLSFVPRALRSKWQKVEETPVLSKAQEAEKQVLEAAAGDDNDEEAFFASLL